MNKFIINPYMSKFIINPYMTKLLLIIRWINLKPNIINN